MDRHLNHLPIAHQNYRLVSRPSQSEAKTVRIRHSLSLTHYFFILFFAGVKAEEVVAFGVFNSDSAVN